MNRSRLGQFCREVNERRQIGGGNGRSSVNDKDAVGLQCAAQTSKGPVRQFGMPTIERAHPHGKGQVEFFIRRLENEILDGDAAEIETAGRHLIG